MSSDNRLICLSHETAQEITYPGHQDESLAEDEVRNAAEIEAIANHAGHDLVIGRYSYPLVAVGCPGLPAGCGRHLSTLWTKSGWLRLLHAARLGNAGLTATLMDTEGQCWPAERLSKLAGLLFGDMELGESTPAPLGSGARELPSG